WNETEQTYYPAGIYLGGSGQSVVRALDGEVVDLFRLAEAQSTGGDQNVGGGITRSSSASIAATANNGGIIINIEPKAAQSVARWALDNETPNRQSGFRLNGAKNTYILRLSTVGGFLPPTSPTVKIDSQKLNT